MNKRNWICGICLSALAFSPVLAADHSFRVDGISSYIWRGFDLNPTQEPVLQPSYDFVLNDTGLALNLWSSISFVSRDFTEIDLTLSYTFPRIQDIALTAGFINYAYFFVEGFTWRDNTSQELYMSAGLPDGPLQPRLTAFYDFAQGDGLYLLLETAHSVDIRPDIDAVLSASLGYNGGQWLADEADPGFSDLNLGITGIFEFGNWTATAFAKYTFILLDALGDKDYFWFGFGLGYILSGTD